MMTVEQAIQISIEETRTVAAYAIGQDVIRIDTGRRGRIEDIDRVTEESSGDAEILVRWGNPIEYEWVAERDIQRDRDIEAGC